MATLEKYSVFVMVLLVEIKTKNGDHTTQMVSMLAI